MNFNDYMDWKAMSVLGLLPAENPEFKEKELLVNDIENVHHQRMVEYVTWYAGGSDAIYNLYNVNSMVEYPTEPFYWKNRRSYYWCKSATDDEIKRTHCGFVRDMIDTTVLVCGDASYSVGDAQNRQFIAGMDAETVLDKVLEANSFQSLCRRRQMPMTLVEGWGAFKITWNVELYGDDPVIHYYRAENVRVYRRAGRLLGMTFLDWYNGGLGKKYLVAETRLRKNGRCSVTTECFRVDGDNLAFVDAEEAKGIIGSGSNWSDMPCLFAEPCSFYDDPLHNYEGRSVLEGKLDLLDDLDQAFSQASNTVRRSGPIETLDIEYCERDPKTHEPKLPKTFERKYVVIQGQRNSLGESEGGKPIDVTQPQLNTQMYDDHILTLERTVINGHLSPSTMGLDIDRKDHSKDDTVRDISVTLFTRNHINKEEGRILTSLARQVLVAKEYLATGVVTKMPEDWMVKVTFDEFSDKSYEAKVESLSAVLVNDGISPEMYVDKVYGKTIAGDARQREIQWITENHKNPVQDAGMMGGAMDVDGMSDVAQQDDAAVLGGA